MLHPQANPHTTPNWLRNEQSLELLNSVPVLHCLCMQQMDKTELKKNRMGKMEGKTAAAPVDWVHDTSNTHRRTEECTSHIKITVPRAIQQLLV